jgi:hypothetical protein
MHVHVTVSTLVSTNVCIHLEAGCRQLPSAMCVFGLAEGPVHCWLLRSWDNAAFFLAATDSCSALLYLQHTPF